MKVYSLEIMVIDFDGIGGEEIKDVIENAHYPNRCISPDVMVTRVADIGEWEDSNPLNFAETKKTEYLRLFPC